MTVVFLGHVDHGKSTLIGRLLYDTGQVPADRVDFARARSAEQGRNLEFAYLLDGLEEEQEQGITIDFTQTGFTTSGRRFILADAPGHREFLKNMLSGASRAEAAVLVIDAAEGVQEQSRRHGYLLTLLGVKQLAVVVNKMDLVGWDERIFRSIAQEYQAFLASIGFAAQNVIPAAAHTGDNIAVRSARIKWYQGPTLLEQLERFQPAARKEFPLRMPVQDIYRSGKRRLLAGRVETGALTAGQTITIWPTREQTTVKSVERWPETGVTQILTGQNAALEFTDPLFAERGMVITSPDSSPSVSRAFYARVVWLGRQPLVPGQRYKLKVGFQETAAWMESLNRVIDTGSLREVPPECVPAGFIAEGLIMTDQPVIFDVFDENPAMGRFVLVDGYQITGGGVITMPAEKYQTGDFWQERSKLLYPTQGPVTKEDRRGRNQHHSLVLWLTGLSGAGKSTIAHNLEEHLFRDGYQVYVLDGDNVRLGLNQDLGFSANDRKENIRRVAEVARLFVDAGVIVLVAFISPYSEDRTLARNLFTAGEFVEIYVKCPLLVCETRDPKGLYQKARHKELYQFTGLDDAYQEPEHPDIVLETDKLTVEECVEKVISQINLEFKAIR
ncbi:adenylyl-sulfate kinase [Lucifera butyrica]|nr:adenylyl-sulfate kinase [Lucifera butyrica]